jgi:putative transposase
MYSLSRKPARVGRRDSEAKVQNNKNVMALGSQHAVETLNALLRACAQDLFAQILAAESARFLRRFGDLRDELGHEVVVRNGFQPERHIETGIGPVAVRFPKLRCRTGNATIFRSSIVPRYVRRTRALDRESVWRYLYGVFCCDLNQILVALLGSQAAHVATLVPEPVRHAWAADCTHRRCGPLAEPRAIEIWAECIEPDPAWVAPRGSMLAVIGADEFGGLRLLALDHGMGDSQSRWVGVVRSLMARGLQWPGRINLGAAATGFGKAIEAVQAGSFDPRRDPAGEPADASHELRFMFAARPIPA